MKISTNILSIINSIGLGSLLKRHTWRDSYNPLRTLDIKKAVSMLESGERGAYAELQWCYRYIEMQDHLLPVLIERRIAALKKLDWNIKLRDDVPPEQMELAKLQQKRLRQIYEQIDNLPGVWAALLLAQFRGFAHLQIIRDDNDEITELREIEQWLWVRDGLHGVWKYNATGSLGVLSGEDVDLTQFVIREVPRPINRYALIYFVLRSITVKDWAAYIETWGLPNVFVNMPAGVAPDHVDKYLAMAKQVVGDARGVLPHGATVSNVSVGTSSTDAYKTFLDWLEASLVLRGTGGKLTMLTAATGMNDSQASTHADAFEDLAIADASDISALLEKNISTPALKRDFAGAKQWAYFAIAANEETDTAAIVDDAAKLSGAGYVIDPKQLTEKTGYNITRREAVAGAGTMLQNRMPAHAINQASRPTADDAFFQQLYAATDEAIIAGWQDADNDAQP